MIEPAETRAYLQTAIDALRRAWPCDHNAHITDPQDGDLVKCPGYAVEMALGFVRFALKRFPTEKERHQVRCDR